MTNAVGYFGNQANGAYQALPSAASFNGYALPPDPRGNGSQAGNPLLPPSSYRQPVVLGYGGPQASSQPNAKPTLMAYGHEGYEAGSDNFLLTAGGTPHKKKDHKASEVVYATAAVYGGFISLMTLAFSAVAWGKYRGRMPKFTFGNKHNAAEVVDRRKKSYATALEAHSRLIANKAGDGAMHLAHFDKPVAKSGGSATQGQPKYDRHPEATKWLEHKSHEDELLNHFISTDKTNIEHNAWWHNASTTIKETDKATPSVEHQRRDVKLLGFMKKDAPLRCLDDKASVESEHGEIHVALPLESSRIKSLEEKVPGNWQDGGTALHVDYHAGKTVLGVKRLALTGDAEKDKATLDAITKELGISQDDVMADLKAKGRLQKKGARTDTSLLNAHSWGNQFEIQEGTPMVGGTKLERALGQTAQRYKDFGTSVAGSMREPKEQGQSTGRMLMSSTLLNSILASTAAAATIIVLYTLAHRSDAEKRERERRDDAAYQNAQSIPPNAYVVQYPTQAATATAA